MDRRVRRLAGCSTSCPSPSHCAIMCDVKTVSDADRATDESVHALARQYVRGEVRTAHARRSVLTVAIASPIFAQAVNRGLETMGPAAQHLVDDRRQWLQDRLTDRVMRIVVGDGDKEPMLNLVMIADGVRFTTWLRKIIYPTVTNLARDRIRTERQQRKINLVPLDEAEQTSEEPEAGDLLDQRKKEILWQAYCQENKARREDIAVEAWYLSQVIGTKPLTPPWTLDPKTREAAREQAAADTIRTWLEDPRSADHQTALHVALTAMLRSHTSDDLAQLAEQSDMVLEHLVRGGLTPRSKFTVAERRAIREQAKKACGVDDSADKRPTAVLRSVKSVVSAYFAVMDSMGRDEDARRAAVDQFEQTVADLVERGATQLGQDSEEIMDTLSGFLDQMTGTLDP